MQTSTAILETLERAIRHPAWAYVNAWHHPPLLVPFRTHAPRSDRTVPELLGVDHVTLTATDLDRSEEFYAQVLGLLPLADFGHARILVHRRTSLVVGLARHASGRGEPFTELRPGLDHLRLAVGSRDELVEWQQRSGDLGVEHTPIRDRELGHHLNFRDPDHIALELSAPLSAQS